MNLVSIRYAFTSAYLKAKDARGIGPDHIDAMLQRASTVQDALENIRDTDIGEFLLNQPIRNFTEAEACLWTYLAGCMEKLERFPLPRDMSVMLTRYKEKFDVANLKAALRGKLTDETPPMIPLGTLYENGFLELLVDADTPDTIRDILEKCGLHGYLSIVRDLKENDPRSNFEIEFRLDRHYMKTLLETMAAMSDGRVLGTALRIMTDLTNLQAVFRTVLREETVPVVDFILPGGHSFFEADIRELFSLKAQELPGKLEGSEYNQTALEIMRSYDKEKSITVVDRVIEKHKYRLLRNILSPRAMSPCNLYWYLYLREIEIRNLRLILKSVSEGIAPSEIRDYLVTAL
ncbi:MAG: V-type ATPase subunit [Deltaproteobacteria bacterium]|nr:V-type ATPase subunit [Deltaproteobacteria bacterium]